MVKDDGSIKINLVEPVQKLPVGQSLITLVEGPTQRAIIGVREVFLLGGANRNELPSNFMQTDKNS